MGLIFYNVPSRKALRRALRNAPTPAEAFLWKHLRRRGIAGCKFRRQHGIGPYVVDFYAPEVRLAVELDGEIHDRPEAREADVHRQQFIEEQGIRVLRFRNDDLFERTEHVLDRIARDVVELREHSPPIR